MYFFLFVQNAPALRDVKTGCLKTLIQIHESSEHSVLLRLKNTHNTEGKRFFFFQYEKEQHNKAVKRYFLK